VQGEYISDAHQFIRRTPFSPSQSVSFQANAFPRPRAHPGSQIAGQYLEYDISGPVTPSITSGGIYWYGANKNDSGIDWTRFGEVLSRQKTIRV